MIKQTKPTDKLPLGYLLYMLYNIVYANLERRGSVAKLAQIALVHYIQA